MEPIWGFETPWRVDRDDEAVKATWSFLEPWCTALSRRIDYNHLQYGDGPHGVEKRRLVVTLPMRKFCSDEEDFRTKFQQTREALALLSVVAHVDQIAWKYLLSRHCGVNLGKEGGEKYEEEIPARFLAVLDVDERHQGQGEEDFTSDLVEFCGVSQWESQSEAFRDDLEKVAVLGGSFQTSDKQEEVRIPIRALYRAKQPFSEIGDRPVDELVKIARAEKTVKAQWETYSQNLMDPRRLQCTFVLEPMVVDFSNHAVSPAMTGILDTLVSDSVWFSHLSLSLQLDAELKADENLAIKSFGQLATIVFDCTRRSCVDSNAPNCSEMQWQFPCQFESVTVFRDPSLPSWAFKALLSAILASQTTKRLRLSLWLYSNGGGTSSTVEMWKWIAYALFSKRARPTLESLALTSIGSMSIADIEAFTAVMTSEHPENELFGVSCDEGTESYAVLQPNARICRPGEEVQELMLDLPVTQVQTFSDDGQSEWVDAVVPGFGRCLLRRDELVFQQDSNENRGGISSLSIELKGLDGLVMNGLGNFLAVVGPSLQLLTLDALCVDFDCNHILQCCPSLEELSLRSRVVDVRFDFQDLNDCNSPFTTDWTDPVAAATDLQDSSNLFTKALRRLRIRLNSVRDAREEQDEGRINSSIAELLRMLEVNETLEFLDVVAPTEYYGYFDDFRAHHLAPISRSAPLAVESKVAFLSIFSVSVEVGKECGQIELDQHVLHKILEFAAPAVARQVYFREWDWLDSYNGVPL